MNLADVEIKRRYLDASREYNNTPLAMRDGWVHQPTYFGLMELSALVKYLPPHGSLIDIGTGKAIVPRVAHKLGARVMTLDSLEAAGTSAIENARIAGIEGHFCDVARTPIPAEASSVDCVYFADVIEHLVHSPRPVIREIFRVLKPGGVCIATTPNAVRLTVRLKVLMGYSNWPNIRDYFSKDFHSGHHHEYTADEFKHVFSAGGFEIIEFELHEDRLRHVRIGGVEDMQTQDRSRSTRTSEPMLARLERGILLLTTSLFPQLRSSMLLVARKPLSGTPN